MGFIRLARELAESDGLGSRDVEGLVGQGRLVRVRRAAYARETPRSPVVEHLLRAEAVTRQRPGAVLAGMSAAALWGLPVRTEELATVRVISGRGHGYHSAGVRQHDLSLRPAEIAQRDGMTLTSLPRTILDVARWSGLEWGVIAADAALHAHRLSAADLEATLAASGRCWHLETARRAIAAADARSESPLESLSRVQLARTGLPRPELQFRVALPGGGYAYGDFAWPDFGVIGECDGRTKYAELVPARESPATVIMREKDRENRLRQAGWWVIRWTWSDAWDVTLLESRIWDALRTGHRQAS